MHDLDIHGLVGVRLIGATEQDRATVQRQLGRLAAPLEREPQIVVHFVERLDPGRLDWVDLGRSAVGRDGFYVTWIRKRPVRVRVDLCPGHGPWEIFCERGVPAVPLLLHLVLLAASEQGCVPLHASAFHYEGRGVLVCGWAKGGKTEALLAFAARGARYVGDEWILVHRDGEAIFGVPENIRLWDWHLQQLPGVRSKVGLLRRGAFAALRGLDRLPQGRLLQQAMPALRRQANVQLPPEQIFSRASGPFRTSLDRLFLMLSHTDPSITVEPADGSSIAARMAASVHFELMPFQQFYLAHRYAFPDRRSERIEQAARAQEQILAEALASVPAWTVRHPYPVKLDELFEAMQPAVLQQPDSIAAMQRSV